MYTANTRNHNIRKTMLHDCLQLSYASIIDRCSSYVTACGTVPPITIEVSDIKTYFYDAFNHILNRGEGLETEVTSNYIRATPGFNRRKYGG